MKRRVAKKKGKRCIRESGKKILSQKGNCYYVTPTRNFWCMRWYEYVFLNAKILEMPGYEPGMDPQGFPSPGQDRMV